VKLSPNPSPNQAHRRRALRALHARLPPALPDLRQRGH
jgi:hypothetical protein